MSDLFDIIKYQSSLFIGNEFVDIYNSFVGPNVDFSHAGDNPVINASVFHPETAIMENCSIENSDIGSGSIIRNVSIKRSIILPNTCINYAYSDNPAHMTIEDSIVGSGSQITTYVDKHHNQGQTINKIEKKIIGPNAHGDLSYHNLFIGPKDEEICKEAFKYAVEDVRKRD